MARHNDRRLADVKETRPSQKPALLSLARFQYELQEGLQRLAVMESGAGRRKRRTPPPCYVLLGPPGSGKTTLLSSLAQHVPPTLSPAGTQEAASRAYAWWFFAPGGILDLSGRFALATPCSDEHAVWLQLLMELREARLQQPLQGVLLTLAADTMATASTAALQSEAALLRQRLNDIEGALGMGVPVYVLVTRWDVIEGFYEFFSRLPEHTRHQVFGWCEDAPQARRPRRQQGATPYTDIGATLIRRLEQLRFFLLNAAPSSGTPRQPIFCFPEEFRALFQRLRIALESLCDSQEGSPSVRIRGLFFCSARQQGHSVSLLRREWNFPACAPALPGTTELYFLRDLLTVVLARDRCLTQ